MAQEDERYEVIFFQTGSFGYSVVRLNGEFLDIDNSVYKMGTAAFVKDLGKRGFKFVSQIMVTMHNGERLINWVFERIL